MDILGVKRIIAAIERTTGAVVPQTEAVLKQIGAALDDVGVFIDTGTDLLHDIDVRVEALSPEDISKWGKTVPAAALNLMDVVGRVALRAGNTMKGMFPLRLTVAPLPGSILEKLLSSNGSPGVLNITITPNRIPG